MSPELTATTPLGHCTTPLATTATPTHVRALHSDAPVGQSQCVAPHGLPVRKGSLCFCWLLALIESSCCCPKDQPMLLPEACSKEVSHLQQAQLPGRSASQALHLCKVQFPVAGVRLAAGLCTAEISIWLVRQAVLQLRISATRSMSGCSAGEDECQLNKCHWT